MSFVRSNGIGSNNKVWVVSVPKIAVSSNSDYGIGFSIEVSTGDNLGDVKICLRTILAMTIGLAFYWLNILASIFPTGYGYLTFVSSVAQLDQSIKPPVIVSQA